MHDLSASSKSQRGLTLIEAVAALAVMAGMMTLVVSMTGNYTEDAKIAVTAQQIRTVGEAARGYINDNQATIAATATATVPAVVTVAQLVAGGYLPAGFTEINNRSQTMCVLVLEPAANNLQGMVITQGGDTVDDVSLRQVSNLIGAAGGSIMSTATTTLSGTQGGWSMAIGGYGVRNCANAVIAGGPGAGHNVMSLWNGGNDVATAFLYRDSVSGRPDLNRMNTSIDMGGFRIVNLQTAAPSAVCGAGVNTGDLASAVDGKLLSCQGGVWKEQGGGSAFWGDPVSQAVAMPACAAANANETRVRYGYAVAPTRRLFTCDGASWVAVGVDHAGNLAVPGDLSVTGATTLTGAVTANSGVTIGDGTAASSTNTLVLNRTATEGAACSPNGAVARDTNGLLLSCQSGVWKKATGNAHRLISASDYNAYLNSKAGAWQNNCNDYILSIDGGGTLVKKINKFPGSGCAVQTMGNISSGPVRIVGSCLDQGGTIHYDWILTFSMSPAGIIEDHYSTGCGIRGYEVHKWVS